MGFNVGGMAAAYEGYQRGQDEEVVRQRLEDDRNYTKVQRDFQGMQQARQRDQWKRDDERASGDAAAPTTRQVTSTVTTPNTGPRTDDDFSEGQMPGITSQKTETVAVPREEQMRGMADRAKAARDMDAWQKLTTAADALEVKRVSAQFQGILAGSDGKTAAQLANEMSQAWNSGSLPMKIGNVRPAKDGSVTVDITDRDAGTTRQQTYKDANQLLEGARALADPAGYAAIQQKRIETHDKVQEEIAKNPYSTVPGGYVDKKTGKFHPTMVGADTGMVGSDGLPIYSNRAAAGAGGAGGAGGGKGAASGKAPKESVDAAAEWLKTLLKDDTKLLGDGLRYVDAIYDGNPNISPRTAAAIAQDAATNPTKLSPEIDKFGTLSLYYKDAQRTGGQKINLAPRGAGSLEEAEKAAGGREGMVKKVQQMLTSEGKDNAEALKQSALDPNYLRNMEAQIQQTSRPENLERNLQAWNNKVELVKRYGNQKPPESDKKEPKTPTGFGMAVPPEVAQKVLAQREAAATKVDTDRADAQRSREATQFTRTMDKDAIQGLSPDVIRALPRDKAEQIYRNYYRVLTTRQRELLELRKSASN